MRDWISGIRTHSISTHTTASGCPCVLTVYFEVLRIRVQVPGMPSFLETTLAFAIVLLASMDSTGSDTLHITVPTAVVVRNRPKGYVGLSQLVYIKRNAFHYMLMSSFCIALCQAVNNRGNQLYEDAE